MGGWVEDGERWVGGWKMVKDGWVEDDERWVEDGEVGGGW